jgi:flagellar hook-associated protein 3 FlgL
VFGPDGGGPPPAATSTFDLLDDIVNDLTSGIPADRAKLGTLDLTALDSHFDNILQQRANLGATAARLEVTRDRLSVLELRVTDARSKLADTDMAKAYMEYQSQDTMYQSALAAGARIMQTSLLDFL